MVTIWQNLSTYKTNLLKYGSLLWIFVSETVFLPKERIYFRKESNLETLLNSHSNHDTHVSRHSSTKFFWLQCYSVWNIPLISLSNSFRTCGSPLVFTLKAEICLYTYFLLPVLVVFRLSTRRLEIRNQPVVNYCCNAKDMIKRNMNSRDTVEADDKATIQLLKMWESKTVISRKG